MRRVLRFNVLRLKQLRRRVVWRRAQLKRVSAEAMMASLVIKIYIHMVVKRFGKYTSCESSTEHRLSPITIGPISWICHLLSVWSWISPSIFIYTMMISWWYNLCPRMAVRRSWQSVERSDWYTVSVVNYL